MKIVGRPEVPCSILLITALLFFSPLAQALSRGFYFGIQGGWANTNLPTLSAGEVQSDVEAAVASAGGTTRTVNGAPVRIASAGVEAFFPGGFHAQQKDNVYGGRIYVGYQLIDQLALELGFLHVRNQTTTYTASPVVVTNAIATSQGLAVPVAATFNSISRKDDYSDNALDFNIKAMTILWDPVYIYAKLGMAYMKVLERTTTTLASPTNVIIGSATAPLPPFTTATVIPLPSLQYEAISSHNDLQLFYPTLGLGIAYAINCSFNIDASWYRIVSRNNNIGNIDTYFIGVSYNFSDWFSDSDY